MKGPHKILNIYPISRVMWWQQLSLEDRMASCPEKYEDSFLGLYFLLFLQKHDNVLNHSYHFKFFWPTCKLKRKFSVGKLNTFNDWKANSSISQVASTFIILRQCDDHKNIFGNRTLWDFCNKFESNSRDRLAVLHYSSFYSFTTCTNNVFRDLYPEKGNGYKVTFHFCLLFQ